jgi:hypothetical protein
MKSVIDCESVFERLTRAPFPSGGSHDDDTELHLQVCHDCRSLAEALRPAIGLFHESLEDDESLPKYNGRLLAVSANEFIGSGERNRFGALLVAGAAACALAWLGFLANFRGPVDRDISNHHSATPDANGVSLLLAMRLPNSCMKNDSLAAAENSHFRCCTECHRFQGTVPVTSAALRALHTACSACHRPQENSTAMCLRLTCVRTV